jgi:hypothetical protein
VRFTVKTGRKSQTARRARELGKLLRRQMVTDRPPPPLGASSDRQRRADGTQSPVRCPSPGQRSNSANTAQCFLRIAELDPISLERVGAYEARLWRQVAQTIWLLDAMRRPRATAPRRPSPKPIAPYLWHRNG